MSQAPRSSRGGIAYKKADSDENRWAARVKRRGPAGNEKPQGNAQQARRGQRWQRYQGQGRYSIAAAGLVKQTAV